MMQTRGSIQMALRWTFFSLWCNRFPAVARRYSSYTPKDTKKRNLNPLLPPRYNPLKNKSQETTYHNVSPKQPLLEHHTEATDNDLPADNSDLEAQTNTLNQQQNNNFQKQQEEDKITSQRYNFATQQRDNSNNNEENQNVQQQLEVLDGVSFEDKEDLEPSICQYMFSADLQYLSTLDFGDKAFFDRLDKSKKPKHARLVTFVSPADTDINKGGHLFPTSVVGYIQDFDETNMNPNTSVLTAENFIPNPLFCDFLLECIAKHVVRDPDMCEYAHTATNKFIPVWDYRSPLVDGMIERENIIGAVKVENGEIVEGELVANEGYKLYDDTYGWCSLSKFIFQQTYQELLDLANKPSRRKK